MIFSDDLLFIHVPKTAGMSVSNALLKHLDGKVYYTVPEGHGNSKYGEEIVVGSRHQTLASADAYFMEKGFAHRVANFKYVVAMVRKPYEIEVSRYHYLRKGHAWDKGVAQKLAMAGDFHAFVAGSKWWFKFRDYYTIDGYVPDNLHIVRYENFEETLVRSFGDCFKGKLSMPRVNKSHNTDYREYFNKETETLVYEKYRWIFDKGYFTKRSTKQLYDPKVSRFLPDRYVRGTCHHCNEPGATGDQCEACGQMIDPLLLIDPISEITHEPAEVRETTHWYLRLNDFEKPLNVKEWHRQGSPPLDTNTRQRYGTGSAGQGGY